MRKCIVFLIIAVCLMLAALFIPDAGYRPFHSLDPEQTERVSISMPGYESFTSDGGDPVAAVTDMIRKISVRYTAQPSGDPIARIKVYFTDGGESEIDMYSNAVSIDGKAYYQTADEMNAMMEELEKICSDMDPSILESL